MRGFFMSRGRISRAVNLNQDKVGRIILILHHVEPGDSGFTQAGLCIQARRFFERLDRFRADAHRHVHDEHPLL